VRQASQERIVFVFCIQVVLSNARRRTMDVLPQPAHLNVQLSYLEMKSNSSDLISEHLALTWTHWDAMFLDICS
jgi:hypothetical protein